VRALFEIPRLLVRALLPEDVDVLWSILGDAEATRYYKSGNPWDKAEVERLLASYPFADERIVSEPGIALLKSTGAIDGYGGVGYLLREGNTADLLFILKPEHWGQGLATELANAAITTAFQQPEIATIYAIVHPHNEASARVLEKCGLRHEDYLAERDRLLYRIDRS
jgi:ribosomal-protein-alanine N-acetyltransferase